MPATTIEKEISTLPIEPVPETADGPSENAAMACCHILCVYSFHSFHYFLASLSVYLLCSSLPVVGLVVFSQEGGGGKWASLSGLVTMYIAWMRPFLVSTLNTECGRPFR